MNFSGLLVGAASFLIIGIFHPIVIKGEYYFSKRIWPVFLIGGIVFGIISLLCENQTASSVIAVVAFSMFWSIKELFEQEQRVKKGWFPKNPKRSGKSDESDN